MYKNGQILIFYSAEAVDNGRFYANAASALHHISARRRGEQGKQMVQKLQVDVNFSCWFPIFQKYTDTNTLFQIQINS